MSQKKIKKLIFYSCKTRVGKNFSVTADKKNLIITFQLKAVQVEKKKYNL